MKMFNPGTRHVVGIVVDQECGSLGIILFLKLEKKDIAACDAHTPTWRSGANPSASLPSVCGFWESSSGSQICLAGTSAAPLGNFLTFGEHETSTLKKSFFSPPRKTKSYCGKKGGCIHQKTHWVGLPRLSTVDSTA